MDALVATLSPEDLAALAQQDIEAEKQAATEKKRQLQLLAKTIEGKFDVDASQRQRKEMEWYWSERLTLGSMWKLYNRWGPNDAPFDTKTTDAFGTDDKPEFNIVKPKLRIARAQLEMMQFGSGTDKNFQIKAKKPAELQSQLTSQAPLYQADGMTPVQNPQSGQPMTVGDLVGQKNAADDEAARLMDEECWAQMSAANYGQKMRLGFDDLTTYGSVIFKGPINNTTSNKIRMQMQPSQGAPIWVTSYSQERKPDFERINPWLFYPDYRALTIEEAEHATVLHIYSPTKLRMLANQDGFDKDAIKDCLAEKPIGDYYQAFRSRAIRFDNTKFLDNKYIILEWHGTVGLKELGDLGIDPPYENPLDMYKAEVWICQGHVLYASLEMLECDTVLPFAVNVWEPDPAFMLGFGAILLRDAQRVVNMTYKMVLDNAGLAALPQVGMDEEAIKPIDGKPEITPGKIWLKTENGMGRSINEVLEFFYPPNNLQMLTQVMNMAREFGDEESGTPLIAGGMGDPQVGDTGATGMAMIMQASTSVLSSKARQWDDNVTRPIVNWFYEWNMQYSPKEQIKGDYHTDVQTTTAYLNKIIQQRDIERLCIEFNQNPLAQKLLRGDELYRARLTMMNIPFDSIVKSKEEVQAFEQQQAQQAAQNPPPEQIKAQADLINAQAHMKGVENDAEKNQFDANQGVQEAQAERENNMANYQTRNNEAQARSIDSVSQRDIAFAQLAAKDKQEADKLQVQLHVHDSTLQADQFQAGVAAQQNQHKLGLESRNIAAKEEELKIKKRQGSGI